MVNFEQSLTPEQEKTALEKELFVREVPEEYKSLIEKVDLVRKPSCDFSSDLIKKLDEESRGDTLRNIIENGVVLDLGSSGHSYISKFVAKLGAKKYIGIDLDPHYSFGGTCGPMPEIELGADENVCLKEPEQINDANVPFVNKFEDYQKRFLETKIKRPTIEKIQGVDVRVEGDMLSFISRLGGESVSAVVLAGIESGLCNNDKNNYEYLLFLKKEIVRVLKNGGIVISYVSDFFPEKSDNLTELYKFEVFDLQDRKSAIYQK